MLGEPTSVSDANGIYAFTGLSAATYTIREVHPPNTLVSEPKGGVYTGALARGGQRSNTDDFGNYPAERNLRPGLQRAPTRTGRRTAARRAWRGSLFTLTRTTTASSTTTRSAPPPTPRVITFSPRLFASTFTGVVRAVLPSGVVPSSPVSQSYAVAFNTGSAAIGKDFATYQIVPDLNASVSGHVFNDFNGNGVEDPGETAVSGLSLVLTGNDTSVTAATDSHGNYVFPDLTPGSYTRAGGNWRSLMPCRPSRPTYPRASSRSTSPPGRAPRSTSGTRRSSGRTLTIVGPPVVAASHGAVPSPADPRRHGHDHIQG